MNSQRYNLLWNFSFNLNTGSFYIPGRTKIKRSSVCSSRVHCLRTIPKCRELRGHSHASNAVRQASSGNRARGDGESPTVEYICTLVKQCRQTMSVSVDEGVLHSFRLSPSMTLCDTQCPLLRKTKGSHKATRGLRCRGGSCAVIAIGGRPNGCGSRIWNLLCAHLALQCYPPSEDRVGETWLGFQITHSRVPRDPGHCLLLQLIILERVPSRLLAARAFQGTRPGFLSCCQLIRVQVLP